MKCRGPKKWYVYKTMSEKTKEKLVRRNIRSVGVYIRRDVVLLAWYGSLSVRWERLIQKQWREIVERAWGTGFIMDEEDY